MNFLCRIFKQCLCRWQRSRKVTMKKIFKNACGYLYNSRPEFSSEKHLLKESKSFVCPLQYGFCACPLCYLCPLCMCVLYALSLSFVCVSIHQDCVHWMGQPQRPDKRKYKITEKMTKEFRKVDALGLCWPFLLHP